MKFDIDTFKKLLLPQSMSQEN